MNLDSSWLSRWMAVSRDLVLRPSTQLALASFLVSLALADKNGGYGVAPLACVTGAALLAVLAAASHSRPAAGEDAPGWLRPALVAILASFLFYYLARSRAFPLAPGLYAVFSVATLAFATELPPLARALARRGIPREQLRLWIWLGCGACFGYLIIHGTPAPEMDVWTLQQEAASALRGGRNPYSIPYRNFFGGLWHEGMMVYTPDIADAEHLYAFFYPPYTLLVGLPSFALTGDIRFANLVGLLIAAWALSRIAPSGMRDLAAALLLFHPVTRHQLLYGWTEPTVLAPALLMVLGLRQMLASAGRRWVPAAVGMGLFAGSKQYAFLLIAPFIGILPRSRRWWSLALAAAVFLAGVLPFMLWDFRGLYRGNIQSHLGLPARIDALSWTGAILRLGCSLEGARLFSMMAGGIAVLAALVWFWPRLGSLAQAAACASAVFGLILVTGKHAFCNYYWIWNALLLTAALLRQGEEPARSACAETGSSAEPCGRTP